MLHQSVLRVRVYAYVYTRVFRECISFKYRFIKYIQPQARVTGNKNEVHACLKEYSHPVFHIQFIRIIVAIVSRNRHGKSLSRFYCSFSCVLRQITKRRDFHFAYRISDKCTYVGSAIFPYTCMRSQRLFQATLPFAKMLCAASLYIKL